MGKCESVSEIKNKIKDEYPGSKPLKLELVSTQKQNFWEDINNGLNYRGDEVSGLSLDEKDAADLINLQNVFKANIENLITQESEFFFYPDEEGIPGYPVYWDFRYVILTENSNCFFIYGAGSD